MRVCLLISACDCKYNMLLTSRLEIAGAVNTSDERVTTTVQGASRVLMICWLGVYLSLERRPLLISRFLDW